MRERGLTRREFIGLSTLTAALTAYGLYNARELLTSQPNALKTPTGRTVPTRTPEPVTETSHHLSELTIVQYPGEHPAVRCEENCEPRRVILHETGWQWGRNLGIMKAYQFTTARDGTVFEGEFRPEAQGLGPDGYLREGTYAQHTYEENDYAVGIALEGYGTMQSNPLRPGLNIVTEASFEGACMLAAIIARQYDFKPTNATILTHYEMTQKHKGEYDDEGKHDDLSRLPFKPELNPKAVKEYILQTIQHYYTQNIIFADPRVRLIKP